jgi:hypothetical protein
MTNLTGLATFDVLRNSSLLTVSIHFFWSNINYIFTSTSQKGRRSGSALFLEAGSASALE